MTIGVLGGKGDGNVLLARLQDPSAEVRVAAIKGLSYLKDPAVYPTVVAMLQDQEKEVRNKAFEVLVRLGKPRLLKLLLRMLGSSRRWPRKAAIRACAKITSAEFVEVLVRARRSEPDPKLRREAVRALMHLAKRGIVSAAHALEADPPSEIGEPMESAAVPDGIVMDRGAAVADPRAAEIEALKAQVAAAKREAEIAQQQAMLIAQQAQAKLDAVQSGGAEPAPAPAPIAATAPEAEAEEMVSSAPAPPGSGPSLSSSSSVSGNLPISPADLLDIEDSSIHESESLELSTAEIMVGGLHDPDPAVRMENLKEILTQKDRSLAQQLAARLPLEDDDKVLAKLLLAVGKLGRKKDARRVARFLRHDDARVRANAVEALAMLGDEAQLEAVLPLLEDTDNRARANAVVALKDHPTADVMATLKGMAKDPDPQMRLSSIYSALEIASVDVDPVLHFLLKDTEQEVKDKALSALNLLEDQRMAPRLGAVEFDPDSTMAHIAKLAAWRGGEEEEAEEEEALGLVSNSLDEEAERILDRISGSDDNPIDDKGLNAAASADKNRPAHWGRPPSRAANSGDHEGEDSSVAGKWKHFLDYLQGIESPRRKGQASGSAGGVDDPEKRRLIALVILAMVVALGAYLTMGDGSNEDLVFDEDEPF
jgi:HEAT repeat protein